MAEVTLSGVSKVYPGGHRAVDAMDLQIPDGRCTVLVGPSGCGKTTTLRMIAGLEDPTGGTISIGGRVVNDVHPKDRDIAMVFQNYALYPHMTVYKNMAFALTLRGVPRGEIEQRVRAAARTLGIEDMLDRRPRQLSGGQRQRVAVGRAIVREPKAFLFDEPLSNLDATLRVSTRAELKALNQRLHTTTVYVTHDQEEAMTLGDQIVVMRAGRIQQVGAPLDVYRAPANRFVAGFIGTPAMNFLDGRLESAAGSLRFVPAGEPGASMAVAPAHASRLAAHVSRPLVLGLRPSALREGAAPPGRGLRLAITVVEPLGDTMDIHGTLGSGGRSLIARIPARAGLAPGSPVDLAVDMDAAHYFEPGEPGRSLLA